MARKVSSVSFNETMSRSTAWAVTFGDMVTLLLTFFILVIVIMNEAEKHLDQIVNVLLNDTYKEIRDELQSENIQVDRVTKGVKITISSGQLFPSADSELRREVLPVLNQIGTLIKKSKIVSIQNGPEFKQFLML